MSTENDEIQRRTVVALNAIKQAFGSEGDEHGATRFVSHHLAELSADYWQEHCGTAQPETKQVLEILTLQSHWGEDEEEEEEDGIDHFDFSLPGGVTDYVISVSFDEDGEVEDITMES